VVGAAERVVFPGQGAMPDCMREIEARGLRTAVLDAAATNPFSASVSASRCSSSTARKVTCRGSASSGGCPPISRRADVRRHRQAAQGTAHGLEPGAATRAHPLWKNIANGARFYFVHSYFVDPTDDAYVVGTTDYGLLFTSAVARDNIFAIQCHPEKSARRDSPCWPTSSPGSPDRPAVFYLSQPISSAFQHADHSRD
jgi:glutamine amidotransferase